MPAMSSSANTVSDAGSRINTAPEGGTSTDRGLTQSSDETRERAEMQYISAPSETRNPGDSDSRPQRRRRTNPGDPCVRCDRPMRPWTKTLDDYPGTRIHKGRGVCDTCWNKQRLVTHSRPPVAERKPVFIPLTIHFDHDDAETRRTAEGLHSWLMERRSRGVPEEGTGWREVEQ